MQVLNCVDEASRRGEMLARLSAHLRAPDGVLLLVLPTRCVESTLITSVASSAAPQEAQVHRRRKGKGEQGRACCERSQPAGEEGVGQERRPQAIPAGEIFVQELLGGLGLVELLPRRHTPKLTFMVLGLSTIAAELRGAPSVPVLQSADSKPEERFSAALRAGRANANCRATGDFGICCEREEGPVPASSSAAGACSWRAQVRATVARCMSTAALQYFGGVERRQCLAKAPPREFSVALPPDLVPDLVIPPTERCLP